MGHSDISLRWRGWAWPLVVALLAACGAPAAPANQAPAAPAAKPAAGQAAPNAPAAPAGSQVPADASRGKQLLDDLVKQANAEGEATVTVLSSWNQAILPPLAEAFKKRFGLTTNVQVATIAAAQHYPVAIAETRAGTPPTYDSVQGDDAETMQLLGAGGIQPIADWELLLAEVNPLVKSGKVTPDVISHGPFVGRGFQTLGNVKQVIYNPRLVSEAELPRTHADLADPRYKDKFVQPPWTAHWELGPALATGTREQWLDLARTAGKNTGAVLAESAAVQRVVLGQYAFALGQDTLMRKTLAADAQAPIAARFLDDHNQYNAVYYAVRTGTRHPATAALWALWMSTPEAEAIWQPSEYYAQRFGDSEMDREQARLIRDAGAKVVGYLDTPKTIELLEWYQSPDGRQYLDAMTKAIKGE